MLFLQKIFCSSTEPRYVFCPLSTIFAGLLFQNHLASQSQISCGASIIRGNKSVYTRSGHMTKVDATPIYGKSLYRNGQMILNLVMEHQCLKLHKLYINDDPGLTMICCTARSNLVTSVAGVHMGKTCIKSFNGRNKHQV